MTSNFSLQIRAVQLDLARQMETTTFICDFIDFIAESGFNTLALYLEGRIRTPSFRQPSLTESYSVEEMANVVAYAASRKIDVIPIISVLSHAELFLRFPNLGDLAETRDSVPGRFGIGSPDTFCPSQSATYTFLRNYFAEICQIFSGPYIHIGCDEAWNMGYCDLCRERLQKGESQANLFHQHLLEVHRIVTQELGKRIILWDDMFEYYPEALESLPRDMVMACWQYQDNVETTRAHFFNRESSDSFMRYDRLGFEYLFCPADYNLRNTESFTAYAAKHNPLGGLLTTWEKSDCFLLQSMPLIGCVGRYWKSGEANSTDEILRSTVVSIFGVSDDIFFLVIKSLCEDGIYLERRVHLDHFLTHRENNSSSSRENLADLLLAVLPAYRHRIKETSRTIFEEIILSLKSERVAIQLEDLLPQFFRASANLEKAERSLFQIIPELKEIASARVAMWHRFRPELAPCRMKSVYENYVRGLQQVPALAATHGCLKVHFMLPDQYSAQTIRFLIRYAGSDSYETIASDVFKEIRTFDCFYSRIFLVDKTRTPEVLRIETHGFGGQGFTYFSITNKAGRFVPASVHRIQGNVTDPENLLIHDWKWTFAGERDTRKSYLDPSLATAIHGFDIFLETIDNGLSCAWSHL